MDTCGQGLSLQAVTPNKYMYVGCSLGIGDQRIETPFTTQNSPANGQLPMTIFYSDLEPL